jgi:protein SCO1/2
MKKIEKKLSDQEKGDVEFTLFSFDSKRDTPAHMKAYMEKRDMNSKYWQLLSAADSDVRNLAAALGIKYKKLKNGDFDHSNIIFIIDSQGLVKYQQVGLNQDPEQSLVAIRQLLKKH